MSNAVPDPDDVMEADYQNHIEKSFQNREGTPVPEDTAPANQNGDMDVTQVSAPKPSPSVVVNNPTAVDVETICQSYKGHSLLIRLQFIADHCPPLKRDATIGMINELHRNHLETPVLDQAWIDQTTVKSSVQLDFLLAEYKKQKDEGVKESTRRAMDELFNYYITAGDITEALHLYSRGMREYCSQFKHIIQVDLDALDLPWLFSASDMAMYCTLCVIASYDRTELKKKVISDANCRKFLESEPKLVELLHCIVKSQFGRALDILRDMKDRFLLDPYLSAHVEPLYAVIRERALLQYLEPFASADLNAMANVFRTDLRSLEGELVTLCERGQLSARIDAVGATIRMIRTNEREENYKKFV
ncbi:PCI domain protein [Teladorsagia circumcincta]|uniref:PCI domain protein n=1 Tax=Teladorsagia circumcincta TaxID=45464 RepID=A0A2G9UAF5_TELCI|nr:PCI domain protein [Teladorsagia circumcincta]